EFRSHPPFPARLLRRHRRPAALLRVNPAAACPFAFPRRGIRSTRVAGSDTHRAQNPSRRMQLQSRRKLRQVCDGGRTSLQNSEANRACWRLFAKLVAVHSAPVISNNGLPPAVGGYVWPSIGERSRALCRKL